MIDMTPTKTLTLGKTTLTRCRGGYFEFIAPNGSKRQASDPFLEELWQAALEGSGEHEEAQRSDGPGGDVTHP